MNKKSFNISYGLLIALFLFSCSKQLNEVPPNTLVADNAIRDEATAETAIVGLYSYFGEYGEFDATSITKQGVRANILEPVQLYFSYEIELLTLDVDPSWSQIKKLWVTPFKLINAANNIIDQLSKFKDEDFAPGKRKEMLAEATFMRGFGHLFIMKEFGHFWDLNSEYGPLTRLEPAGLNNNRKARSSVSEGYEIILEDLRFAAENLRDFTSIYQVSKPLAKSYLVEVLLMRGQPADYTEGVTIANDVIENGPFELETPYSNVYSSGYSSSELMFSRKINPENIGLNDLIVANVASIYNLLGRKQNAPSDMYLDLVPSDDARFPYIIGDVVPSTGVPITNTWIKHFHVLGDLPMRYFSLTQLYLYYSEALLRSGASVSQVLVPMNVLRERGGMPLFQESDIIDRKNLEEILFRELLIEIGADNGSEYFAAVRFQNSSGERMIKELNPSYERDDQLAFPIPDDELLFNQLMKQNP